jgi:hypothetical protein
LTVLDIMARFGLLERVRAARMTDSGDGHGNGERDARVDEADSMALLDFLNEDLFTGGLTDAAFRSDRKSPRS